MLNKILAISGKSGLFRLVSSSSKIIIVESLNDGKRMQIRPDAKVISLRDIAIYTDENEVPLKEVLESIKKQCNGEKTISHKDPDSKIKEAFASFLPDYDRDRVYLSDMKKVILWYNILQEKGMLDFEEEAEEEQENKQENKQE